MTTGATAEPDAEETSSLFSEFFGEEEPASGASTEEADGASQQEPADDERTWLRTTIGRQGKDLGDLRQQNRELLDRLSRAEAMLQNGAGRVKEDTTEESLTLADALTDPKVMQRRDAMLMDRILGAVEEKLQKTIMPILAPVAQATRAAGIAKKNAGFAKVISDPKIQAEISAIAEADPDRYNDPETNRLMAMALDGALSLEAKKRGAIKARGTTRQQDIGLKGGQPPPPQKVRDEQEKLDSMAENDWGRYIHSVIPDEEA